MAEGGIDRGNVRFRIDVEGTFAERLKALRQGLLQARRDFRGLREDVRALGPDSRKTAADLGALVTASRRLREEARKSAQASVEGARATGQSSAASRQRTAAVRTQEQAERRLSLVQREAAALERRLRHDQKLGADPHVQQLRTRLAVTQQLIRAQQRLRIAQSLADRGRDTKTGELDTERQRRQIIEAQSKAKQAQADLENQGLRRAQARLAVEQRILKTAQQQGAGALAREGGLLPTGQGFEGKAFDDLQRNLDNLKLEETRQRLRQTNPEFQKMEARAAALSDSVAKSGAEFDQFGRRIDKANLQANRISFTFRRLFGILAAFTAARLVLGFFTDLVKDGVKFNAMIEQSVLGLGALLTAVGDVRDATGQTVDEASQLELAMGEARRQVALLRAESLKAPGTFSELLETFQVAIAPGRQAGLIVDEIRKFTIQISQAAAALGVPQNQLTEEIRSVLSGTIQARTTRIASALGITNEDIRRAKELGRLSEFLEARFKAFSVAGERALGTFDVLISNLHDAMEQLFGTGATGLFNELKGLFAELQAGAQSAGKGGILEPNPEAVAVVRALLEGIKGAVTEARRLRAELSLAELEPIARALGHALEASAQILGRALEIVLRIFAAASVVVNAAFTTAQAVAGVLGSLGDAIGLDKLLRMAEVLVGIALGLRIVQGLALALKASFLFIWNITKVWKLAVLGVKAAVSLLNAALVVGRGIILTILSPVGLIALALVGLVVLTKQWIDSLLGADATLQSVGKVLKELVSNFILQFMNSASAAIDQLQIKAVGALRSLKPFADQDEITKNTAAELQASQQAERMLSTMISLRHVKRMAEIKKENEAQIAAGDTISAKLKNGLEEVKGTFADFAKDLGLSNLFGLNTDDAVSEVQDLASAIDGLPAILGRGQRDVEGLTESLKQLEEELRRVRGEARVAAGTAGIEGFAAAAREEVLQGGVRLQEEALRLDRDIDAVRSEQIGRQVRINRLLAEARDLQVSDVVAKGEVLATERLDIRRNILETETQIAIVEQEAAVAARDSDKAGLDAADARRTALLEGIEAAKAALAGNTQALAGLTAGSPAQAQKVTEIVSQLVELRGQEFGAEQDIVDLTAQRGRLEGQINSIISARVATIARQEVAAAQQRLGIAQAELQAQQLRNRTANIFGIDTLEQRRAAADGELLVERARLQVIERQARIQTGTNELNLRSLDSALERQRESLRLAQEAAAEQGLVGGQESRDVLDAESAVSDVEEAILETRRAQSIAIDEQNIALEQQRLRVSEVAREAERLRLQQEEGFRFGIQTAFAEFSENALNTFERWQEVATQFFGGLAEAFGAAAADAIDPNTNADLRNKLGNLFKAIAQQLFTNLAAQIIANVGGGALSGISSAAAITSAAATLSAAGTGLTGAAISQKLAAASLKIAAAALQAAAGAQAGASAAQGAGAVAAVAVHGGGAIPTHGKASLAHYLRPQGLRIGGRPRGIHPDDTVPIWAQPGEHMIRKPMVDWYWPQTMDAINKGLVDPVGLRALAGVGSASGMVTTPTRPSFAGGGAVSEDLGRTDRRSDREDLLRAALIADEATMRMLVRGGRNELSAAFNERSATNGALFSRRGA